MRLIKASIFLAILAVAISGQLPKPVDESKLKEVRERKAVLTEQILADATGLKLPENRAFVLAKAGSLLWKDDKGAAQGLFQRAVNELAAAQSAAELDEKGRPNENELRLIQPIRQMVLGLIGASDAEFALESLYRTRTASITRAMVTSAEQTAKIADVNGMTSVAAHSESALEQRLIRLSLEQNPETAAKLLQDTIKKGLSNETLALLRKLHQKDPEAATSLASETMDRLLSSGFTANVSDRSNITLAMNILTDHIRPRKPNSKELRFEEMQIRSLSGRLVNFYIGADSRMYGGQISQVIKIAEKLSPGSVAALRNVERRNMPPGAPNYGDARRLAERNLTAPQLMAEARKLPADSRAPVYQSAANKMAQSGDITGAIELLNANFSGRALENAVNSLNWNYAGYLMNQGKWSEAERVIDEFPDSNRRSALIDLAKKAFAKNATDNRSFAISVLNKVRSILPEKPANQTELTQFMQLSSAFAPIEPDEAFSAMDPIVPQLNELADATAITRAFQNSQNVRSGEFLLVDTGNYGFEFDQELFRNLSKADFERTTKLIDRFSRREMRIAVRFRLAETGLN